MNKLILMLLIATGATSNAATTKLITFKDAKGQTVGTATLTQLVNGVKINLEVKGLTPGEHAFHVHDTGACVAPKFDSAGGHFSPAKTPHGFDSEKGPHVGDMPNLVASADGTAKVELVNTQVTLSEGPNSLLKSGGTAFIIHEKADDYKSQPAGNAGARIVCGEIKP